MKIVEITNLDGAVERYECVKFYCNTVAQVLELADGGMIYVAPSSVNKIKVKEIGPSPVTDSTAR